MEWCRCGQRPVADGSDFCRLCDERRSNAASKGWPTDLPIDDDEWWSSLPATRALMLSLVVSCMTVMCSLGALAGWLLRGWLIR